MLYLIGLGLGDEKDITIKGLEAVKKADLVFLESYTSILGIDRESLSSFYGKEVVEADREFTEVVGDPFSATTHTDLVLRCRKEGIQVEVFHNASILNAVGKCGLQLYKFGETVSLVFFTDSWKPDSFYDKIARNRAAGLHTLCLLDIKLKEPNLESLARGKVVYEPPRMMTISHAIQQLLDVEDSRKQQVFDKETLLCVGLARIGHPTECIAYGSLQQLADYVFVPY
ncbi:Diphthine methyl ester synthase [Galdieria sulphuraria]|nr:Diphthine methyl ester synthase [Galdieria sulphuraria]